MHYFIYAHPCLEPTTKSDGHAPAARVAVAQREGWPPSALGPKPFHGRVPTNLVSETRQGSNRGTHLFQALLCWSLTDFCLSMYILVYLPSE